MHLTKIFDWTIDCTCTIQMKCTHIMHSNKKKLQDDQTEKFNLVQSLLQNSAATSGNALPWTIKYMQAPISGELTVHLLLTSWKGHLLVMEMEAKMNNTVITFQSSTTLYPS